MHSIGIKFSVCMSLESRDKSLNIFKIFVGTIKENERSKKVFLLRISHSVHKIHSMAS